MSAFWLEAAEIFETARADWTEDAELAVVVDSEGGVQVLTASGWDAEALRLDRGARSAFRISRLGGRVRVEGRAPGERCLLEAVRQAALPVSSGYAFPPPG